MKNSLVVIGMALLSGAAFGQNFQVTVDGTASSLSLMGNYGVNLDATLIGDFDATTNPTGTRTEPGFLGGSGNTAISVDMGLNGDVTSAMPPGGTFDLSLDRLANTLECTNLDLDLLGGGMISSDLNLDLMFQTFRSYAPDSLYVGGFPVSLPLGAQSISDIVAVQNASSVGILTPNGNAGDYDFTLVVPASISLTIDLNGTPTPVGPFDVLLPLAGSLLVDGDSVTTTFGISQSVSQTVVDPLPGFMLTDVPFPVPTILPPGGTANLLLNGTVADGTVSFSIMANVVADGPVDCDFSKYCEVNPNSTGMLGLLDVMGSTNVINEDLTLTASQLPTGVFGIYLMSPAQDSIILAPPGQGVLCMGSPFFRFSSNILFSGVTGTMQMALDFQDLPQNQVFQAGSTWNFQLWHRDMNPSNTSNTTHAVSVVFCP